MKVAAGVLAAALAGGCGGPSRIDVALLDYTLTDAATLQVYVGACNADVELAEIEETPTEVRLRVVGDEPGRDAPGCADGVLVPLAAPLAGRTVVDASTGESVPSHG